MNNRTGDIHIFRYNYPEGELRTHLSANAAIKLDILNDDQSMSGPLLDTHWHGRLKTINSYVEQKHILGNEIIQVVDIDLSQLPPGTRFIRVYAYNLQPKEDK